MYRSPSSDSPLVVTAVSAVVTAFHRLTGQVAWRVALSPEERAWATRCEIVGDRVFTVHFRRENREGLFHAGAESARLTALDYGTGAVLFSVPLAVNLWTPTLLVDRELVFIADGGVLHCVSATDGTGLWRAKLPEAEPGMVPIGLAVPGASAQADAR